MSLVYTPSEPFTDAERALLAPFVTDLDAPIFGLRNLPEGVRGALFALQPLRQVAAPHAAR